MEFVPITFVRPIITEPLMILGVLCANVAISEWLCRKTVLRHFGTALVVILLTAVVANVGILPTKIDNPVYDNLLGPVVNLAVFWLLLRVDLRALMKAGLPMIAMFCVGAFGTLAGAICGMMVVNGATWFPDSYAGLTAMFTGTYVGGSVNFVAMAESHHVEANGQLYLGSVVVDNIVTTIWMVMTIAIPRGIGWWLSRRPIEKHEAEAKTIGRKSDQDATEYSEIDEDTEPLHPLDLALILALGIAAVAGTNALTVWLNAQLNAQIPSILFLTIAALAIAQTPLARRLKGARTIGLFAVYLFLAVIGALCDLRAAGQLEQAARLLVFAATLVAVHGIVIFGIGSIFRVDRDVVAVASQANIGGGTSALANARSLGRSDLALPAILVGSLGTGLGNFLGLAAAKLIGWLS